MFPDHFLDANVLIASRFDLDVQCRESTSYEARVKRESIRQHTSFRVLKEARNVFELIRDIGVGFLQFICRFEFATEPEQIARQIVECRESYKNRYTLNEKEEERLDSFVELVYGKIVRYLREDPVAGISTFMLKVSSSIKKATKALTRDCDSATGSIRSLGRPIQDNYPQLQSTISTIIADNDGDIEVLLDAVFTQEQYVKKPMCFITFDKKHFLDNKQKLESVVNQIYIQSPNYS